MMQEVTALINSLAPLLMALAALVAAIASLLTLRQAKATHRIVNSELAKWKVAAVGQASAEGFTAGETAERLRQTDPPELHMMAAVILASGAAGGGITQVARMILG